MHKEVIIKAFDKAKKEEKTETGIESSVTKCAKRLSAVIFDKNNFSYHERSLINLYNNASSKGRKTGPEIKQPQVVNALCNYLGFENYEDFVLNNYPKKKKDDNRGIVILPVPLAGCKSSGQKLKIFIKRNKIVISISAIFIIIAMIIITSLNQLRWMIWQENHYVEATFDTEKIQSGQLRLYKTDRKENFKQISATCDTLFFNEDGSVRVWYGKNKEGELEYFTALYPHPRTRETLKPITQYVINKYICMKD